MPRVPKMLWLVPLFAMLLIRISGLHEHVCLDGMDTAASFQFSDSVGSEPGPAQATQTHSDVDVSLLGDALPKKLDVHADVSAVAPSLLLILFIVSFTLLVFPRRYGPPLSLGGARSHIRPLLRAPPRHTSLALI